MSTRQRHSSGNMDDEDLADMDLGSNHSTLSDGALMPSNKSSRSKRTTKGIQSPKRVNRRQSRLPPALNEHGGSALLLAAFDDGASTSLSSLSAHSRSSHGSTSHRTREQDRRRSRSARVQRTSSSRSGGTSTRGGEKNRVVASEDDNWQMFKEALQNMA